MNGLRIWRMGALAVGFSLASLGCEKRSDSPASDAGRSFGITFQIYDGVMDAKTQFQAKLRVRTTDGQVFEYGRPIAHADCYLLASMTGEQALKVVEGDEAHLVCSGGGTDEATVTRKSETNVEVTVFQKAFAGPDTPPSKPEHEQTFSIRAPKGARLQTSFEVAPKTK